MASGAMVWGIISIIYKLYIPAAIPFGYILITTVNLSIFSATKNLKLARVIQIFFSLLLPFFMQWLLGGFQSSGMIMLWSVLALVASLTFRSMQESYVWLTLFLVCTLISGFFDASFLAAKPEILPEFSRLFTVINLSLIACILFGLTAYFVNQQLKAQNQLANNLIKLKKQEEQIRKNSEKQLEFSEKLYLIQRNLKRKNKALLQSEQELKNITKKQLSINEKLLDTQEELKTQEQKFRSVVENAPLAIFTIDQQGIFTLAEGSALHQMGLKSGALVGTKASDFFKENTDALQALNHSLEGKSSILFHQQGDFILENHMLPLHNKEGKLNSVLVIAHDVTEKKKAEEKLEIALQRAKKSEEKMRSVAEDQLEISEKLMMAERELKDALEKEQNSRKQLLDTQSQLVNNEKMASLGQLTAGIAHEINNPINFVYNGIDTLKITLDDLDRIMTKVREIKSEEDYQQHLKDLIAIKEELDVDELSQDIKDLVEDIKKGATRTMEIVKGLRVFSRLDEEEQKPADINENIDATLVLLQNKLKGVVEVKKYYDETIEPSNGYPGPLNQVFMNILSNGIQAIPEDEKGSIKIYTENKENEVIIRIKDSGIGMSEEVQKRIFEPFYTTKPVGIGTGLGLSISFGIIEKHKGQIYVNSEEGKGTEFVIHLPKH
jgi:PAS domain S-box-containing protein